MYQLPQHISKDKIFIVNRSTRFYNDREVRAVWDERMR